jgi:hypothetical protein
MITHSDLARAATVAREVDLTTFGRETERPSRRTDVDHHRCVGQDPHPLRPGSRPRLAAELACQSTCSTACWQLAGRRPLPFETSRLGLFAVGDLRSGSMKRVAAAVGEGSAAVRSVHQYLAFDH